MVSGDAGKLVTLKGTVVRCGPLRPLVTAMSFSCAKCGAAFRVTFEDGIFAPPTTCETTGCRARAFAPMRGTATSVDWRRLRVQARMCERA
jgi:DNA replicative helicase MCM subunit Mcm2 (Cdc46/Mcm family)